MINEAMQYLMASGQSHLLREMMHPIIAREQLKMPDIQSQTDWINFAHRFVEYCFVQKDLKGIETHELPSNKFEELLEPLFDRARSVYLGRRFFVTTDGRIGLGHESLQRNDCIAALFGGDYPFILRPATDRLLPHGPSERQTPSEERRDRFRFVGLAWISGIMDGEAVDAFEEDGVEPKKFCLW
jgi:hypothetical protein